LSSGSDHFLLMGLDVGALLAVAALKPIVYFAFKVVDLVQLRLQIVASGGPVFDPNPGEEPIMKRNAYDRSAVC
jgi:hypothetical protein